jgi:hypothetical protein
MRSEAVLDWLPSGKRAAVCFTVDDVHPGRSDQHYDGGGDLGRGALGLLRGLLDRHPELRITLFTTADWREISPAVTRTLVAKIPVLRERLFLTAILPKGSRRIDRHPEFVRYLSDMPRTEIGLHGLHHVHPGKLIHVEFQNESVASCEEKLREMLAIFESSGLRFVRGMCPPGWNAPPALIEAMSRLRFDFLASARDIRTDVAPGAEARMSGLQGVSLIHPTLIASAALVHFTSNFQATSSIDRALAIVEAGGVLAVKAHIIKDAMGHVALDGVDRIYCNFLDLLFAELQRRYGTELWWTTMGEMAARVRDVVSTRTMPAAAMV